MKSAFWALPLAVLVVTLLTPLVRMLAFRLGAVARPGGRQGWEEGRREGEGRDRRRGGQLMAGGGNSGGDDDGKAPTNPSGYTCHHTAYCTHCGSAMRAV